MRTGSPRSRAGAAWRMISWSRARSRPWSWASHWWMATSGPTSGLSSRRAKSSPLAFQWSMAGRISSLSRCPIISSTVRKPSLAIRAPDLLGDEEEVVDQVLGFAGEALAQLRVLGGHPHRAGVQVAFAHHDAARDDQGRGGEAELVRPQQGTDDHVAPGAQAPIDLDRDAPAQAVEHQGLVGLRQADLPGGAGVLDGGQRAGPGAAVVAGDGHMVRVGLGDTGRHGAHADLGDELDRDPRPRD